MNVSSINKILASGEIDSQEVWPRLTDMAAKPYQFRFEFGLDELPTEAGLITIRGPRQFGKSTWLDLNLRQSIRDFGRGSAFYLNGDELATHDDLIREMTALKSAFSPEAPVKRLFIDEITAISDWEKPVKRLIDQGMFRDVLIITTGSKATDLRRGTERLPGRKGRLKKSEYIFLPISYREFKHVIGPKFQDSWMAYLLAGGSPIALNDICETGHLPEYFIQLTRDWIYGEIIATGRSRIALTQILKLLMRYGGQPVGYAKLAREAGLANNTVASGYIEQLTDLLTVLPMWPWDAQNDAFVLRKPCKFQFINLAALTCFYKEGLRHVDGFKALSPEDQAPFLEWLVAQEIWRRGVLAGAENPESIGFWASKEHEIDFVTHERELIEVKRGRAGPLDFVWFPKVFPKKNLTVVCPEAFRAAQVRGITMEDFLLEAPTTLSYS